MKLDETIELNGKEYTVELNRESVVRVEQYTKTKEAAMIMNKEVYSDKSNVEIGDDEDPFASVIDEDEIEKLNAEKDKYLRKMFSRAFWIWLYPVEKLTLKQVEEILEPYFVEESKAVYLAEKYQYFTEKSVEVRQQYLEEQKNLKALAK